MLLLIYVAANEGVTVPDSMLLVVAVLQAVHLPNYHFDVAACVQLIGPVLQLGPSCADLDQTT